jgi:hypothetical protein
LNAFLAALKDLDENEVQKKDAVWKISLVDDKQCEISCLSSCSPNYPKNSCLFLILFP